MSKFSIEKAHLPSKVEAPFKKEKAEEATKPKLDSASLNVIMTAYSLIYESARIGQETVNTLGKQVKMEVSNEDKTIRFADDFTFKAVVRTDLETLDPDGNWVSKLDDSGHNDKELAALNQLTNYNVDISAIEGVYKSDLSSERQSNGITVANMTGSDDITLQSIQESSSLLQMLQSLTMQIAAI